jgi:aromatic ring-cleaving dioxygenase|tara:strand:+ start:1029 stop:1268 length:240 start_codon:yes stop_codon:yes gene_type:complete
VKIGDLVQYKNSGVIQPLGLVVEQVSPNNAYHHRIRVAWIGEKLPIQANVFSTNGSRITTWVDPKKFEVVSHTRRINGE